jgi:hypothetical protein
MPSATGFYAVRFVDGKPTPNALRFDLSDGGGLGNRQKFARTTADRTKNPPRSPHDTLAFDRSYFYSSVHKKILLS